MLSNVFEWLSNVFECVACVFVRCCLCVCKGSARLFSATSALSDPLVSIVLRLSEPDTFAAVVTWIHAFVGTRRFALQWVLLHAAYRAARQSV